MKIIGYQSKVNITQVLPCEMESILADSQEKYYHLINHSWLFDPFGDHTTYGAWFSINSNFSWSFFLYTKNPIMAERKGQALLLYLMEKYKGLDGNLRIFPLYLEFLEGERPIYEIIIPNYIPSKIQFLKKLINFYNIQWRKINMEVFVLWRKDDLSRGSNLTSNYYMINIFASFNSKVYDLNSEEFQTAIEIALEYITSDMIHTSYDKTKYKKRSKSLIKEILTCNIFPKRVENQFGIHDHLPASLLPTYVKPDEIDFFIPEDIPLLKPPILDNRNIISEQISNLNKNYIYFGNKLINGVLRHDNAIIEIDTLTSHLNIFGKSGTGKSTLLEIIIYQLHFKRPDVGILLLNLVKPDLEKEYPMATVYAFPSKKLRVPYITTGIRVKKSISGTSNVLAASLGIKYVGPIIISETFQRCYMEFNDFPSHIMTFFDCLENNLMAKPYDPDTQKTILTAFRRRIDELFADPQFGKTLRFHSEIPQNIPEWFLQWKKGDVVLLDLTICDEKEQYLLIMLIFQMIETLIPFTNSNTLKYIVAIDEAHRVVGKSRDNDPESAEFIMKNRFNALFSNTIEECRSKGLGLIISEQRPYRLLDSVIDSAGIKILFRLGYPNNELFTGNIKEREMLLNLQHRCALILNGTNGERYLSRIIDEKN